MHFHYIMKDTLLVSVPVILLCQSHLFSFKDKRVSDLNRSHGMHLVLIRPLNHIMAYRQFGRLLLTWPTSTQKVA